MSNYFAGITVGVIILQTMVFAPTIFKTLDPQPAGKLLRGLFPKFFRLLVVLGAANLIALGLGSDPTTLRWILAGLTCLLPLICALLVPATNRAKDEEDKAAFKRLHATSVILTVIVLLGNIAMPFV